LLQEWTTHQVDYDSEFAQAELTETVAVEIPIVSGHKSDKDLVLNF